MNLADLPQFIIDERHDGGADEAIRLVGRLSHRRGIHNPFGALYISGANSVRGDLELPSDSQGQVTIRAVAWSVPSDLGVGAVLPWLDGYWEPIQLERVLDSAHQWERRTFAAEPAQQFTDHGVNGWQKVGAPLPEGAEATGVRAGGWDHEHCDICRLHIGVQSAPDGYVDAMDVWLCTRCFGRYAARQDIAFVLDA